VALIPVNIMVQTDFNLDEQFKRKDPLKFEIDFGSHPQSSLWSRHVSNLWDGFSARAASLLQSDVARMRSI